MAKSKKQKELDEDLSRQCCGYFKDEDKPNGMYVEEDGIFFNMNKIKRLIEEGADVNAKDDNGDLPLHYAVRNDNRDLVELLIEEGADVNTKDKDGQSPLHWAKSEEIAELLIEEGADVNAKDDEGRSPLELAVERNNRDTVYLLLKHGINK